MEFRQTKNGLKILMALSFRKRKTPKENYGVYAIMAFIFIAWFSYSMTVEWQLIEYGNIKFCEAYPMCCGKESYCLIDVMNWSAAIYMVERMVIIMAILLGGLIK